MRKTTCEDLNQRIKGEANSQLLPAMAAESKVTKINVTFIYISLLNSSTSAPSFLLHFSLSLSLEYFVVSVFSGNYLKVCPKKLGEEQWQ